MKTRTTTIIISAATLLLSTALMSGSATASSNCVTVAVAGMGSSAGGIAKFRNRRAERRANKAWEQTVSKHYGSKYADIDDATVTHRVWGRTSRGNPTHTVTATFQFCS